MLQAINSVYLSDLSPKDKPWDERRGEADGFKALYKGTVYHCYAVRIADCSCNLVFAFQVDENGLCKLKLQAVRLCRVRLCPVCQGRRALKWTAKTIKIMPKVLEAHPKARFIMLTLTVRNCPITELRSQLTQMHEAWRKLVKRKEWKVQGWIRSTEVTRGKDDSAHPHYHCLLMVSPGYFGNHYISQERWRELWQECLRIEYQPWVDVRAVKAKKRTLESPEADAAMAAVVEVIKYAVKPSDILRAKDSPDTPAEAAQFWNDRGWLLNLTEQLHKTRAIATGGVLKDYLKVLEDESDNSEDLVHIDEDGEYDSDSSSPRIAFDWSSKQKRYAMQSE